MSRTHESLHQSSVVPPQNDEFTISPAVMTEGELIQFLRIPTISKATNHHNVIENLKRLRNLPRVHICNKALYPKEAVMEWLRQQTTTGN
jgi:hypothetical protein